MVVMLVVLLASGLAWSRPALGQSDREGTEDSPPNIVFIMADDLGYGDLEPYGQEKIITPHLARMARRGMRFTQFYSGAAVCAPLPQCADD